MKRGRKPGSLSRYTCFLCGAVEMTKGGCSRFRCSGCKDAGIFGRLDGFGALGKERAGREVREAIRSGVLAHASAMRCVDCGAQAVEYDHRDYNRPLLVEPVCRPCNLVRGPAIPLRGSVEHLLETGYVPYATRAAFRKLCRTMGKPEAAQGLPSTRMTLDDWRQRWPLVVGSHAANSSAQEVAA